MKDLLKNTNKILKPYIKYEILGVIFTLLYSFSSFLTPRVSAYLIDEVIPSSSYYKLSVGILIFAGVCILQPVFGFLKDRLFVLIKENITYDIRLNLFSSIIYAPFKFFDKIKGGKLISIVMNDGRGISNFISTIFSVLLKDGLMLVMIIIGMFLISSKITITVLIIFAIIFFINIKLSIRLRKVSKEIQYNYDDICSCVNQTNKSIVSIKMSSQEKQTEKRFISIIGKMKHDNILCDNTSILINNLTNIAVILCLTVIYGFGSLMVMEKVATIGNIIAMGLYFQLLSQPLFELMNVTIDVNIIKPMFDRINDYENIEKEQIGINSGKIDFDNITIKHLSYFYENESNEALHDINIILPSKGIVNIVGESGSGKSTLTKLLIGMYDIPEGHIIFGNKDISNITPNTLRNNISYVPQDCDLLNDTIINNICYGTDVKDKNKVEQICIKLRLQDKLLSLPEKYNSLVTEKANLSGGEKQRILIARAILKDTNIIIMDEPFSALDDENINIVSEILMNLSKTKLVILVTHYENSIIIPTLHIEMNKGNLVESIYTCYDVVK